MTMGPPPTEELLWCQNDTLMKGLCYTTHVLGQPDGTYSGLSYLLGHGCDFGKVKVQLL